MSDLQFATNTITKAEHRTGPDGRHYLVASGVAIVEGVLGNELVLASEFGRHVQGWAGRPLVVDHPEKDGHNISANSPDTLEQMAIGQFWNPRVDGNRLVGEYWFDIEKIQRLGGDAQQIAQALTANRPVEESTAYFRDLDRTPGEWNGKPYIGIARNIVPDHVAVLANKVGNCSLADGCGVLVNSKGDGCECGCSGHVNANADVVAEAQKTGIMVALFVPSEAAQRLVQTKWPDGSDLTPTEQMHVTLLYLGKTDETTLDELTVLRAVSDFAKSSPVMRATIGGIGRFSKDSDGKNAVWAQVDSPVLMEWQRQLTQALSFHLEHNIAGEHGFTPHITLAYVPKDSPVELITPERQEVIFDSIALSWGNKTTVFPLQGEVMSSNSQEIDMSEETQANTQAEDKELNGLTEAALAMVANAVREQLSPLQEKLSEYDKWFSDNGGFEQVRETLQLARSHSQAMAVNAKRERDALVTALVANERCRFTAEQLEKLDIEALGALAESLQPVDYSGRGFAANRRDAGMELKPLEMPEVA